MKVAGLVLLLCACVAADLAAVKSAKAKLLGKIARAKHHKRGVLAHIPTFKLGHDIPHVSHSVVKPLVVTYPPTALPLSVKVPLHNPLLHHHHRSPFFHKHHHKAQEHFHHHHHHVTARPAVPLLPAPPVPLIPAPSVPVVQQAPPPLQLRPTIVPLLPRPPVSVVPPHLHLRPVLQAPVTLPAPLLPAPAPQLSYVIRPGNAVQTSFFATYPKYPFYQPPVPLAPVAAPVFLDRPAQVPLPLVPGFHAQTTLLPTPTLVHAEHPTQIIPTQPSVHLDHNGWSPIQAHAHGVAGHHLVQDQLAHDQAHFVHDHSVQQFAHEQAQHFAYDQAQFNHDQEQHLANEQAQHLAHEQAQHFAHDQAQFAHDQAHHFAQDQAQHYAHDQAQHFAHDQAQFAHEQAQHYAHDQAQFAHEQAQHFAHDQAQHYAHDQAQHFAHDQAQFAHEQAHHFAHDQAQFAHDQAHLAHDQSHLAHDQAHLSHDQAHLAHESHYPDQGAPIYEEHQEDFHHQYQGQDSGYHYSGPVGRSGEGGDEGKDDEHNPFPSSLQPPIDEPRSQFN